MHTILSFLISALDRIFPETDTLDRYLEGSTSLAEIEHRQLQWEREHGHSMLYR